MTECIAEHTAMNTITSSKWLALIMSRSVSRELPEPSGLDRKKTAFSWLEFPLCNNKEIQFIKLNINYYHTAWTLPTILAQQRCWGPIEYTGISLGSIPGEVTKSVSGKLVCMLWDLRQARGFDCVLCNLWPLTIARVIKQRLFIWLHFYSTIW